MSKINYILARFEQWLDSVANQLFALINRHKVGILGSIAVNLMFFIALLIFKINSRPHLHETIVAVDFIREYEIVQEKKAEPEQPILPRDAINPKYESEAIKNFAIDATKEDLNSELADDKNIDAEELYRDAQRAREQMQQNKELWEKAQNADVDQIPNTKELVVPEKEIGQYKGPTVISYYLENRKARRLPVPAYKCERGGQVVVEIEVDREGKVSSTNIDKSNSVIDECMNSAALSAARSSLFTSMGAAPVKQKGSITYLFVAQ